MAAVLEAKVSRQVDQFLNRSGQFSRGSEEVLKNDTGNLKGVLFQMKGILHNIKSSKVCFNFLLSLFLDYKGGFLTINNQLFKFNPPKAT